MDLNRALDMKIQRSWHSRPALFWYCGKFFGAEEGKRASPVSTLQTMKGKVYPHYYNCSARDA